MESESKSQTVRNLTFAVSLAVACVSLAWLISSPSFEPMIAFIASTGTLLGSADVLKSHTRNAYARLNALLYSASRPLGILTLLLGLSQIICGLLWLTHADGESLVLLPSKFSGDKDVASPIISPPLVLLVVGAVTAASGLVLYFLSALRLKERPHERKD